jgi:putative FmdB family regulatory protein
LPLYEFDCQRCGERFEELVRAGAGAPCSRCGERETRRVFSSVSTAYRFHIDRGRARDSDLRRSEREARRLERFSEARRRRREQGGGSGDGAG